MLVMDSDYSISSKVRSSPKKSLNSGWQPVRGWRPPTYQRLDGANNIICLSANLQLQGWRTWYIVVWWWQTRSVETSWPFICVFQRQKQMWIYKVVMCWAIFCQPQELAANWTDCVTTSWWVTAGGPTLDLGRWCKLRLYILMQWWLLIFFFSKLGSFSFLVSYLSYTTLNSQ